MILTQTEEAAFVCEFSQGAILFCSKIDAKISKIASRILKVGSGRSSETHLFFTVI